MSRIIAAMFITAALAGIYFWAVADPPEPDNPTQTDETDQNNQ